jgi:hypothetical protein
MGVKGAGAEPLLRVVVGEDRHGDEKLAEIALALGVAGRLACPGQRRQEQEARMPMMAITTSSSTKRKAVSSRRSSHGKISLI